MAVKEEASQEEIVPVPLDDITIWRAEQFSLLKFGEDDAFVLASTRNTKGFYLYWGDIEKTLKAGATHAQIVDWYT